MIHARSAGRTGVAAGYASFTTSGERAEPALARRSASGVGAGNRPAWSGCSAVPKVRWRERSDEADGRADEADGRTDEADGQAVVPSAMQPLRVCQ